MSLTIIFHQREKIAEASLGTWRPNNHCLNPHPPFPWRSVSRLNRTEPASRESSLYGTPRKICANSSLCSIQYSLWVPNGALWAVSGERPNYFEKIWGNWQENMAPRCILIKKKSTSRQIYQRLKKVFFFFENCIMSYIVSVYNFVVYNIIMFCIVIEKTL